MHVVNPNNLGRIQWRIRRDSRGGTPLVMVQVRNTATGVVLDSAMEDPDELSKLASTLVDASNWLRQERAGVALVGGEFVEAGKIAKG